MGMYKNDLFHAPDPISEKDDFWEIDMLVPKTRIPPRRVPSATDTAEISFGHDSLGHDSIGDSLTASSTEEKFYGDSPLNFNPGDDEVIVRHYVYPATGEMLRKPETPILEYAPEGSLIHHVKVFPWPQRYRYYQDFCKDAARFLSAEPDGNDLSPVPYFSYVPQYSQLSREQKNYYFYWRRELRQNRILPIEDSYLYLYLYEIINTAGVETPPEEGLRMLYRVYRAYGAKNPRLSRLLSEWICDYSLLFRLPVPAEERSLSGYSSFYMSSLKEFYMSSPTEGVEGYTDLLLSFCTAYDYRTSHFYRDGNRGYFDRYLPGALMACVRQFSAENRIFSETGLRDSHIVRNAFDQALCSYRVRYRIEVDYASFSRSHELRYIVSDILKYTENRLRGFLGIKSRLSVYSLSTELRKCIDRYCDENFPRKSAIHQKPKKPELVPVYEKLYDLPPSPLSLSHAAEIEESSWETTRRLTEAFSEDVLQSDADEAAEVPMTCAPVQEEASIGPLPTVTESPDNDDDAVDLCALFGKYYPFLEAAYMEDFSRQYALSKAAEMLPDLIADRINEIAAETLGDILLEETSSGYTVIDDYRTLFSSLTDRFGGNNHAK